MLFLYKIVLYFGDVYLLLGCSLSMKIKVILINSQKIKAINYQLSKNKIL